MLIEKSSFRLDGGELKGIVGVAVKVLGCSIFIATSNPQVHAIVGVGNF